MNPETANDLVRRIHAGQTEAEARAELGLPPASRPAPPAPDTDLPAFLVARRSLAASAELAREVLTHTHGLDAASVGSLSDEEAVKYAAQALTPPPPQDQAEIESNLRAANAVT